MQNTLKYMLSRETSRPAVAEKKPTAPATPGRRKKAIPQIKWLQFHTRYVNAAIGRTVNAEVRAAVLALYVSFAHHDVNNRRTHRWRMQAEILR